MIDTARLWRAYARVLRFAKQLLPRRRRIRMLRYISIPKLERLEGGSVTAAALGIQPASVSMTRARGIQSRLNRVEKTLHWQKLLGTLEDKPCRFQFLEIESDVKEFIAQGVVVWVSEITSGYVITGGSPAFLDRNAETFTSKGLLPGSNPTTYYAGLAAIYRQAFDASRRPVEMSNDNLAFWPINAPGARYHAEFDERRPEGSPVWRIEAQDDVMARMDPALVFRMASIILHTGAPGRGGRVRQLILVHTDHIFGASADESAPGGGSRLLVGSPLYVEQLEPWGGL